MIPRDYPLHYSGQGRVSDESMSTQKAPTRENYHVLRKRWPPWNFGGLLTLNGNCQTVVLVKVSNRHIAKDVKERKANLLSLDSVELVSDISISIRTIDIPRDTYYRLHTTVGPAFYSGSNEL